METIRTIFALAAQFNMKMEQLDVQTAFLYGELKDEDIIHILKLSNFEVSKSEINALFRNEDHPNYVECGDQLLRNFLNGLIIHLRGTKEDPKNPREVLSEIAKNKTSLNKEDKKPDFKNLLVMSDSSQYKKIFSLLLNFTKAFV